MEATQRMPGQESPTDHAADDEDVYEDENRTVLYAKLVLEGGHAGDDRQAGEAFNVYGGENKIGRDPEECDIVIGNNVSLYKRTNYPNDLPFADAISRARYRGD